MCTILVPIKGSVGALKYSGSVTNKACISYQLAVLVSLDACIFMRAKTDLLRITNF